MTDPLRKLVKDVHSEEFLPIFGCPRCLVTLKKTTHKREGYMVGRRGLLCPKCGATWLDMGKGLPHPHEWVQTTGETRIRILMGDSL